MWAFCALLFSSCVSRGISVLDAGPLTLYGLQSLDCPATLENRSQRDFTLVEAELTFSYKSNPGFTARLAAPVSIPAREVVRTKPVATLQVLDLMQARTVLSRMESLPERVTVSGTLHIRRGKSVRKIRLRNVSVSRFLPIFGGISFETER